MAGSARRESANEVNDRPNCPAESKLQVRLCLCVRAHVCVCVCVCMCDGQHLADNKTIKRKVNMASQKS